MRDAIIWASPGARIEPYYVLEFKYRGDPPESDWNPYLSTTDAGAAILRASELWQEGEEDLMTRVRRVEL